MIKGKYR